MLTEKVRGMLDRLQKEARLRRHFSRNLATGMRDQGLGAVYAALETLMLPSEMPSEKDFRREAAGVTDYLATEAKTIASIVKRANKGVPAFVPKKGFRVLHGRTPGAVYECLDKLASKEYKAAEEAMERDISGLASSVNQHLNATAANYEIALLPSLTPTTHVFIVKPQAYGVNAERLNAELEHQNLGFVVKIAAEDHVRAEVQAYNTFLSDARIKTAARLLGSIGNAEVLTSIPYRHLAEFVREVKGCEDAGAGLLHALKYAHLRQVVLAHLALGKTQTDAKQEAIGPKLYDALSELFGHGKISAQDVDADLFTSAAVLGELLGSGALAPRLDPSSNNSWVDVGGTGLEQLVAFAQNGDSSGELLRQVTNGLYISDFKRTGTLYPKFDDAIEVQLNTGAVDVEAILRGCKVFNAMESFYQNGTHSKEEEEHFLEALYKWDTPNASQRRKPRTALIAYYKIDPEELPAEDAVRMLAMTATRLLRWSQKVKNAPMMSTASDIMMNRDPAEYVQKASEALQLARQYSSAMTAEEKEHFRVGDFTVERALGYLSAKLSTAQPFRTSLAQLSRS